MLASGYHVRQPRFRKGKDVEWYIVKLYLGGSYEFWDQVRDERQGQKCLKEYGEGFALVRMTLDRIRVGGDTKHDPVRAKKGR